MKAKLTLLFVFIYLAVAAQQDAQYTQYMLNTANINPAYAGSKKVLSVFGLHRSQWVGLEGAPTTNTLAINTPIQETKWGAGISLISDKIGPINSNSLSADLSYTVDLDNFYKLSFGVKGTANLFSLNADKLNPYDTGDLLIENINNKISPNIGTGVYLHSDNSYLGISASNILQNVMYSDVAIYKEKIHYYLIGGHVFDLDYSTQFKPAFLVKAVKGAPLQVDISANILFNEKLTLGVAYRWSAAVSAMAGFQISDGLYLGYAYDFDTTSLGSYNSGSHEIFLRFEIFKRNTRISSPRFF